MKMRLLRLQALAIAGALLAAAPVAAQTAEAQAALEVTAAEQAYLAEHYSDAVEEEVGVVLNGLEPMTARLHDIFPPGLHAEVDAAFVGYFHHRRDELRTQIMHILARGMTLEEMRGVGLNTRRSLEISAHISEEVRMLGQRLAMGALRHVWSVVQQRAAQECGALMARVDQIETAGPG